MSETYVKLCDNDGNCVAPGVMSGDPVLASGITITDTTTGGDETQTGLVAGQMYQIMAGIVGGFILGVAAVTSAENVLWFVPAGQARCFRMPFGYTTLHFMGLVNSSTAYIVKMK